MLLSRLRPRLVVRRLLMLVRLLTFVRCRACLGLLGWLALFVLVLVLVLVGALFVLVFVALIRLPNGVAMLGLSFLVAMMFFAIFTWGGPIGICPWPGAGA